MATFEDYAHLSAQEQLRKLWKEPLLKFGWTYKEGEDMLTCEDFFKELRDWVSSYLATANNESEEKKLDGIYEQLRSLIPSIKLFVEQGKIDNNFSKSVFVLEQCLNVMRNERAELVEAMEGHIIYTAENYAKDGENESFRREALKIYKDRSYSVWDKEEKLAVCARKYLKPGETEQFIRIMHEQLIECEDFREADMRTIETLKTVLWRVGEEREIGMVPPNFSAERGKFGRLGQ